MFRDYAELRELHVAADLLASMTWPELYDEVQLGKNEVDVYTAIFIEDMYVDFDYARTTASKIRKCKTFVTNISKTFFFHCSLSNYQLRITMLERHAFLILVCCLPRVAAYRPVDWQLMLISCSASQRYWHQD